MTDLPVSGLADGTAGELITWDATGSPATVPVGTSGFVLTSNGAGAPPTFQTSLNVKSGSGSVTGTDTDVTFNTAFSTAPDVVVSFTGDTDYTSGEKGAILTVYGITTSQFTIRYEAPDGVGTAFFDWIATDAGNP